MTIPRIMKAILGLVAAGGCVLVVGAESPTVDLTLMAPWSAPNLIVEIAETIATHNETAYFNLVHEFVTLQEKSSEWNDHQVYDEAVKIISTLGEYETNFFKLSLAIHEATPRIESYNQYYKESVVPSISRYDDQCRVWAQLGNTQYCDFQQLQNAIQSDKGDLHAIEILPFDHIIRPSSGEKTEKNVVLYTDIFSSTFADFHTYLTNAVEKYNTNYIIRYRPSASNVARGAPLYLSGYGVEMALKKTDYLVIDDRASGDNVNKDSVKEKLSNLGKKIGKSLFQTDQKPTIESLTSTEIHSLGLKAAQYVATSTNPLETLSRLSQDFPKYAKSISALDLDVKFKEEILDNQASFVRSGMNAIWLNGKGLEHSQTDPFYLVRALRNEYKLISSFQELGFTAKEAIQIISSPILTKASRSGDSISTEIYDVRETPAEPFINWWNDIEKDSKYKEWSSDVADFLRPSYPGQLPPVKRNIFNLIIVEDLARPESLARITSEIQTMIKRFIPLRFGTVSLIKDENSPSTIIAKSLNYLIEEYGKSQGMKFLTAILESTSAQGIKQPTLEIVQDAFSKIVSGSPKSKSQIKRNFDEALQTQNKYADTAREFLQRMGINDNGIMFLNGRLVEFNEEKPWVHALMPVIGEQTKAVQTLVYTGQFTDDLNYLDYSLEQGNAVRNRNSFIIPSNSHPLRMLEFNNVQNLNELKYFHSGDDTVSSTNLWIISDFNSLSGLKLGYEALLTAKENPKIRIALIHNPFNHTKEILNTAVERNTDPSFSDLLHNIIYSENTNLDKLEGIFSRAIEDFDEEGKALDKSAEAILPGSPVVEILAAEQGKKWAHLYNALEKDGISRSFSELVINGRVVGPLDRDSLFTKDNFNSLYNFEYSKRIAPVEEAIFESENELIKNGNYANILAKVSALIEIDKMNTSKSVTEDSEPVNRNRIYQMIRGSKYSRVVVGDTSNSFLEIGMILDPLSETAQKWTPVIQALSEIKGVSVIVYLNPVNGLTELPLKRFYRYVFDRELHFDKTTGEQTVPTAFFGELPVEPLYTLGVETTNAWHVTVREANMDLDNILLTSLKEPNARVSAVYELESILIEGHCLDSTSKAPPRGLQFEISSPSNSVKKDTLVMANLGYFQLKARPGVWRLGLREGRSSEIYSIENIGTEGKWNFDSANKHDNSILALTSFEGLTVMPLVHKNPGMENEDVLESRDVHKKQDEGLWSSFSNKLFGKKNEKEDTAIVTKPKQAEINIFSVASGKLYERFLSIMITSVMRHTESTVKFWFIENFLSPEFKDFVPHMSKEYGFEYEMVTYKWPAWLRSQQEKQRTIWGYKILFLDVLFPLSLEKVIFVDADQIVRTDLKELVDMDLQGAPYGYTPFCSDRTEMNGFRFWTEGYWKSHLEGKPYHISALYVVDLVRFRELAAGDRLRAQYQQLSADPHSLANLDQDLPNNMQHIVPIFSLPQEWLWCETWCSDESLKKAKTIDLCNNPLTKEPKLDRARRQIPEWESYDNEIDKLRQRVANSHPSVINGDQIVIKADSYTHDVKHNVHEEKHVKDEL